LTRTERVVFLCDLDDCLGWDGKGEHESNEKVMFARNW
jgi:hypothetical protein